MNRAELFSAIRQYVPGQKFVPDDIAAIDALADKWGIPRIGAAEPDWLSYALPLIKRFEGCRLTAYPDPGTGGDPWTIGWGSIGPGIKKGVTWTQDQADARLAADVLKFGEGVDKALAGAATTANQKGALVSLAYNIGLGNFTSSTLLKKHRAADYQAAGVQFLLWNKAAGKVLNGLVLRREAESRVYMGLPA
jgi:lysozyme